MPSENENVNRLIRIKKNEMIFYILYERFINLSQKRNKDSHTQINDSQSQQYFIEGRKISTSTEIFFKCCMIKENHN
jgi:hypothetical protein